MAPIGRDAVTCPRGTRAFRAPTATFCSSSGAPCRAAGRTGTCAASDDGLRAVPVVSVVLTLGARYRSSPVRMLVLCRPGGVCPCMFLSWHGRNVRRPIRLPVRRCGDRPQRFAAWPARCSAKAGPLGLERGGWAWSGSTTCICSSSPRGTTGDCTMWRAESSFLMLYHLISAARATTLARCVL